MEAFETILQRWQLHPVADHFTVSLLIIAIIIDLLASLAPSRAWLRYMALTLMVLGALAAGASFGTGDIEADRIGKTLAGDAKAVLHRHAQIGEYLAIAFGVLALWRIGIEALGFVGGSRPSYLVVMVAAAIVLCYQAHLGGELVFDYGVGTALTGATPVAGPASQPTSNASLSPTALATVFVATPPPSATPTVAAHPPSASATPVASPAAPVERGGPSPAASPAPASPRPSRGDSWVWRLPGSARI